MEGCQQKFSKNIFDPGDCFPHIAKHQNSVYTKITEKERGMPLESRYHVLLGRIIQELNLEMLYAPGKLSEYSNTD